MIEYIYTLNDPITNQVKYIGKTKNIKKRLNRHINADTFSDKDKWVRELISNNLLPKIEYLDESKKGEINDLEIYWISQFKQWGFSLLNMTDGGDGGDGKYWKGRKHSIKTLEKMKKCSSLRKGIIQYNKIGEVLNRFSSTRDASKHTGCHRVNISRCCRGILKSSGGFVFKYDENDIQKFKKPKKYYKKYYKKEKPKIIHFNLNGDKLGEYKTITEASQKTSCHISLISNCCKNKKYYTVNKTTFRYEGDKFDYIPYNKNIQKLSKKVIKYTTNGDIIESYDSINFAANKNKTFFNHIKRCCEMKYKKNTKGEYTKNSIIVKGYTYRYSNEEF